MKRIKLTILCAVAVLALAGCRSAQPTPKEQALWPHYGWPTNEVTR